MLYTGLCCSLAVLVAMVVMVVPAHGYYQGRHVCTERKKIQHPVAVTQSYRRPVFRKDLGKVVYVTAHRTVFKMEMRSQLHRACCNGWQKRVPRETGCLAPVCKDGCENGGHCIAPGLCMCADGYIGHRCHIDINECAGRHKCQQKCVNLPGTYKCGCQKGFELADDETSCGLCLTCAPEFKSLQDKIVTMDKQIANLEREKQSIEKNLTQALSDYKTAVQKMDTMQERSAQFLMTSSVPSTTESEYLLKDKAMPLDRLASLSQQISILEERIADCDCNSHDYY